MVEASAAGAAAGLIASGRIDLKEVARQCKLITVTTEEKGEDLALVDAALLVDDLVGNLLPFDTTRIRQILLARSEPTATGTSAIGGYLIPAGSDDDFGVWITCGTSQKHRLRVPISAGLYETIHIDSYGKLPLGEEIIWEGPGILALDGDRELALAKHQQATLRVARTGPWIIDVKRTMQLAATRGAFLSLN